MLERILHTDTFQAASGALEGLSARHTALSDNIANANTPGYKRKDVPFESELARYLKSNACSPTECAQFRPRIVRDENAVRQDGSSVDIEREMVELAENSLRYQTLTQYVSGFFTGLKTVINSGR